MSKRAVQASGTLRPSSALPSFTLPSTYLQPSSDLPPPFLHPSSAHPSLFLRPFFRLSPALPSPILCPSSALRPPFLRPSSALSGTTLKILYPPSPRHQTWQTNSIPGNLNNQGFMDLGWKPNLYWLSIWNHAFENFWVGRKFRVSKVAQYLKEKQSWNAAARPFRSAIHLMFN